MWKFFGSRGAFLAVVAALAGGLALAAVVAGALFVLKGRRKGAPDEDPSVVEAEMYEDTP